MWQNYIHPHLLPIKEIWTFYICHFAMLLIPVKNFAPYSLKTNILRLFNVEPCVFSVHSLWAVSFQTFSPPPGLYNPQPHLVYQQDEPSGWKARHIFDFSGRERDLWCHVLDAPSICNCPSKQEAQGYTETDLSLPSCRQGPCCSKISHPAN